MAGDSRQQLRSANPIVYVGATPVFVDSEPDTWNMDPVLLKEAIEDRHRKTGRYPSAIVLVHLYGMPAKLDEIIAVARSSRSAARSIDGIASG